MGNEFTGFEDNAPTLTLEPDLGESKAEVAAEPEAEAVKKEMEQTVLSPEEQQMVDSFAKKIDIENTSQILQYGAGTQKKMADFSDAALENVRTQDLGEVGDLITQVVGELRDFDAAEEEKGFLGFFKKQGSKIENMKNRYAKAEVNVQKITTSLQDHQMRLMKDSAVLEKMYAQNLNYYKELTMYILAGKQKLQEVREGKLKDLEAKAAVSGLPEDAQEAKDLDSKCNRFEKKLHDLELTRTISLQTAPQIRLVQNNDTLMVEKIQTTIVNTIPLWKSQMVLALGIAHSTEAAQAQRQVKVRLALEKIVEVEGIAPTDEEVEAEFQKLADQYNMDLEMVKKYLPADQVKEQVVREKVIKLVADSATATAPVVETKDEEKKAEAEKTEEK